MNKKGFHYKLEAVLKIRRSNEEKARIELGYIQQLVDQKLQEILNEQAEIELLTTSREKELSAGVKGFELHLYPMYIQAKNNKMKLLNRDMRDLKLALSEAQERWFQSRADVKVLEKLREKELLLYKKNLGKKQDQALEEEVRIWLATKEA
jgi:flagellar export protein FliJ